MTKSKEPLLFKKLTFLISKTSSKLKAPLNNLGSKAQSNKTFRCLFSEVNRVRRINKHLKVLQDWPQARFCKLSHYNDK